MFDLIRQHNRAIMFVLVLLVFPSFVFFGIQGYSRLDTNDNVVATVDGVDITQAEWDNAFRFQVEQLRQTNPSIDPAQFDTPRVRNQVLEQIVRERVLFATAARLHLTPSDERLQRAFASDPQFASVRNPDGSVNREVLAQQGLSSAAFAERLRQDMALRQVTQPISTTALVPAQAASAALGALFQQREVQMVKFEAKDYRDKVTADDAEVRAYYDDAAHSADFMAPEVVDIEYLVLDLAEITRDIKVSDEEVQRFYDDPANAPRFTSTEQRRARHILVQVAADASADDKAKAKAKAEELLALVRKDRATFPEVARKESSDTVSAQNGGDLDYFGRDAMVAPFADAVFSMKKGDLSGVVETEYGFHIIEVLDIRGGAKQPLDAVRSTILDELRRPQADRVYAEKAAAFSDGIDDRSDSLQPTAEKLGLKLQEAKGVQRTPAQGLQGPLASATLLKAVFEPDSLVSKRNTRAIQIGSGQLAAARVQQHTPARKLPFEAVEGQAKARVIDAKALKAAREAGEARLAEWKAAPDKADLPVAVTLSRVSLQGQPRSLVDAVMKAKAEQLPAWEGVDMGTQGYAVVRINKVLAADASAGGAAATLQYGFAWGAAEEQAYLAALRERYKVSTKPMAASAPTL